MKRRSAGTLKSLRARLRVATLAAGVTLLAGCMDYRADVKVNDDGSGSARFELALDVERASKLPGDFSFDGTAESSESAGPKTPEQVCESFLADSGGEESNAGEVTTERINTPGRCALVLTASWAAGEDPSAKFARLEAAANPDDPEGGKAQMLNLVKTPTGGWMFSFEMPGPEGGAASSGEGSGFEALFEMIGRATFEGKVFAVSVTLPGRVTEHNGKLSGNTVTWEVPFVDIMSGEVRAFTATSEPGASNWSVPWLLIGVVVITLGVLGVLALFAVRQLNRPRDAGSVGGHYQGAQAGVGFYPDPYGRHELRLWDGSVWTPLVQNRGVSSIDYP